MVQLIIRLTGSLVVLAAAIYIHQCLPNTEFNNYLFVALLAFFVAEGPIYGIEKSTDRIDNGEYRETAVILSIIFHGAAVLAGAIVLTIGCLRLL
jgi:hypothetical protein